MIGAEAMTLNPSLLKIVYSIMSRTANPCQGKVLELARWIREKSAQMDHAAKAYGPDNANKSTIFPFFA
jgi:hypothetical protein